MAGVCPPVGKAKSKARAGSCEGLVRTDGILGLEPTHLWMGSCIMGSLDGELWDPKSGDCALMWGARSWAPYWQDYVQGLLLAQGVLRQPAG